MIKSKIDAREEAARLALASGAKDFTKKATEIYDFLTKGIKLPDVDDGSALFDKVKSMYPVTATGYDKAKS